MNNNIFCFHGADAKVGVTMIAQSVAELIASRYERMDVLYAIMNGRSNKEYFGKDCINIDEYKLQMDSRIIISKDFKRDCKYKNNLYVLAGLYNEQDERYYQPEASRYLLDSVKSSFDLVIVDTGTELDNGISLGALTSSFKNYLVITQYESNLSRFEKEKEWFKKAKVEFEGYVINKFLEDDPYTIRYIQERLSILPENIIKINSISNDRQPEREKKTYFELNVKNYTDEIIKIANNVLNHMGHDTITKQKKGIKWKGFI